MQNTDLNDLGRLSTKLPRLSALLRTNASAMPPLMTYSSAYRCKENANKFFIS